MIGRVPSLLWPPPEECHDEKIHEMTFILIISNDLRLLEVAWNDLEINNLLTYYEKIDEFQMNEIWMNFLLTSTN